MATDPPPAAAAESVTTIGLRRVAQVGVAVPDLDEAIAFYGRVFGMRCVHVETNEEQGVREAMLSVGATPAGGCIQLLAPLSDQSPIAKFLDRSGPGVQQGAHTVADVEATSAELRRRGMRLLSDTPRRGHGGSR